MSVSAACHPWHASSCCHEATVVTPTKLNEGYGAGYEWDRCGPMSQACERFFVHPNWTTRDFVSISGYLLKAVRAKESCETFVLSPQHTDSPTFSVCLWNNTPALGTVEACSLEGFLPRHV